MHGRQLIKTLFIPIRKTGKSGIKSKAELEQACENITLAKQCVGALIRKGTNLELWRCGTLELWNCREMKTDNLQSCDQTTKECRCKTH